MKKNQIRSGGCYIRQDGTRLYVTSITPENRVLFQLWGRPEFFALPLGLFAHSCETEELSHQPAASALDTN